MPKTKFQSVVFTAITAWIMVYIMTLYNTVLASNDFTNHTFLTALTGMWTEYALIFLCAFFLSAPIAKRLALPFTEPGDRPIVPILATQIFTVILQVAFASILGTYHAYGFTIQFLPHYLTVYCRNFLLALPVQIFIAGPAARLLFRTFFSKNDKDPQNR